MERGRLKVDAELTERSLVDFQNVDLDVDLANRCGLEAIDDLAVDREIRSGQSADPRQNMLGGGAILDPAADDEVPFRIAVDAHAGRRGGCGELALERSQRTRDRDRVDDRILSGRRDRFEPRDDLTQA